MVDSDKIKNSIIDQFYNESDKKESENKLDSEEALEFKNLLNSTSGKLEVLHQDIFDFDIDTLSIIEQGQCIREKRKFRKEFILFILFSTLVLSLYAIAIIEIGYSILIISQILIITIAPWIIIPIMARRRKGSEV